MEVGRCLVGSSPWTTSPTAEQGGVEQLDGQGFGQADEAGNPDGEPQVGDRAAAVRDGEEDDALRLGQRLIEQWRRG